MRSIRLPKRSQQHRVEQAEDGAVRANAEREGQHRDRGKSWILAQAAEGKASVLKQRFEEKSGATIASMPSWPCAR
jgi:hypothetical protein